MKINIINIEELSPNPKNEKKHPKEQIDLIAKSIERFGFNVPIIVDKKRIIIAGHGRYLAAKK